MNVLSLDFGGTQLRAAVIETHGWTLLAKRTAATPAPADARKSLIAIRELVGSLPQPPGGFAAVGASFGGPVEADARTVSRSMHVPGFRDFALADWLESRLGCPAAVLNDGNAGAIAEHRLGAGKGRRNLLYVTVSTGIGGGIIAANELVIGNCGKAGEIGHLVVDPEGPTCSCGTSGCLEAMASGSAIARDARLALRAGTAGSEGSILRSVLVDQVSARDVARAAALSDPLAERVWTSCMHWLGAGIAAAVNLLDPGLVVIGGGVTRAGARFFEPVAGAVRERCVLENVCIEPSGLDENVCLFGAALFAKRLISEPVPKTTVGQA